MINKSRSGFTLIELLVAIAITAIIIGGITVAIFQVVTGNARDSNHMTAVRQVQNAGYWFSRDAQMAQSIMSDDDATEEEEVLTLSWTGWERKEGQASNEMQCIDSYRVRYTYDSNSGRLWRHQRIATEKYDEYGEYQETSYTPGPGPDEWDTTLIAEYIINDDDIGITLPTSDNYSLVVTIKASIGAEAFVDSVEEERTYEITPRPST